MARKTLDITGEKYGRLTAKQKVAGIKPSKWICQCECGNTVTVLQSSIRNGNTKSCGCINKENIAKLQQEILTTHGMTGTREYIAWNDMKARCHNPNNRSYKNYGAKGITVCPTWVNSFEQFYKDMGAASVQDKKLEVGLQSVEGKGLADGQISIKA